MAKLCSTVSPDGIELGLRARIIGAARVENRHQIGHGGAVLRHRAKITLRHDAAHVIFRPRLDPDRMRAAKQQRVSLAARDDAAGGGDDGLRVCGDDAFERATLMAAEGGGAGHLDQIRNPRAVILFDDAIELDERPAEMFGKLLAERRFAGAAQPDQRDALRPVGLSRPCDARLDQFGQRRQFAFRHLREQIENGAERRVAALPVSGNSAAAGRSSASAIARNTLTDGLPAPLSICAR